MDERNAYFQLADKVDGTYIKLFPQKDGGEPLKYDIVAGYLTKKKITEYDIPMLAKEINDLSEEKEIFLNHNKCLPEMEFLEVIVDSSRLKATGIFYPPSFGGKLLEKQDIVNELLHLGIRYGVIEKNIDIFIKNRVYCTEILLAEALLPVQGKSAGITYHFKTEGFGKPKINEDGSVDFHQLDMINKVNAGDVLATLVPADYGKPGLDIFGTVIKPVKVNAAVLKHGSNIHLSEDKLIMYSDVSGHVMLAEDRVFVSDTYDVPADVSVASGDIDYDGNVTVHGNVVSGFTVKAKGDIIVEGVVEGATLIAEGQIILKRGIQGKGKGKLISKGNITARFIENCELDSGGTVTTEAIMHSKVMVKGDVVVTGKKSMITGGVVKAGKNISAKTLGSVMCTQTFLKIGLDDAILKEFKDIENEIDDIKVEQEKFTRIFAIFKKKMESGNELNDEQKRQFFVAKQGFSQQQEKLSQKENRYAVLKAEIENFQGGRIIFTGVVYPGVKVEIAGVSMHVKEQVKYGQFVRDRADIRIMSI